MKKILCLGTIVTDILSGPFNRGLSFSKFPPPSVEPHAGGNGYNVAAGLVKLGIPGKNTGLCSACGNDTAGALLLESVKKRKIRSFVKIIPGKKTASSLIISFKGDKRHFIGDDSTGRFIKPLPVLKALDFFKPSVFYAGETSAMPRIEKKLPAILKKAKKRGCLTFVDYIIINSGYSGTVYKAAPYTDALHINEYEAKILCGTRNLKRAAVRLYKSGIKLVTVSSGEKNLIAAHKGILYEIPVFKIKCVDATGAGDAFTAGLIKKINFENQKQLIDALIYAMAAGAAAVTRKGCTEGIDKKLINTLIKRQSTGIKKRIKKTII